MAIVVAPLEEAIRYHGRKTPIGTALRSRALESVPRELWNAAQMSAGVESARVVQRIQDGILGILSHSRNELGGLANRTQFISDLSALAESEGLRPQDDGKRGTIEDVTGYQRLSLIYEMQTGMAYGYANWKIGNDPDLIEAFPAQELVRVRQAKVPRNWRVRWDAAGGEVGWEGAKRSPMVALKSSPIWRKLSRFDNPWPPFDYNSGMWVEDVSWEDAARLGLVKRDEAVRPQDQSLLDQTEVSVESLSPEVRELLDRHFEGQVEIRDGKLRWIQQPSGQGQILESTPNDKPSTMGAPYGKQAGANKGAGAMADARRALESAEADTRGGGRTTPAHDESRSERVARIEREERRILSWAGQRGLIASALPQADDLHGEHGVHYDETSDRYIKFTRADKHQGYGIALGSHMHGASPGEYLDRLLLQNELFGDDVRLVGVHVRPWGKVSIVTSQPRIVGEPASTVQIDALMVGRGFTKLADGAFLDEARGLLVFDMFPRNVIRSADGTVYPIDPVIQRVTQDFADFLKRHPERIHDRR